MKSGRHRGIVVPINRFRRRLIAFFDYIHSEFHSLSVYDLSVRDRDKTMSTNMTGREKTSDWLFYPFSELLANESLCIINSVDNGFSEVAHGKEGLNF